MRVTMKRKEYGNDNIQFIDKEPGEATQDLKTFQKGGGQVYMPKRRELEIGLQAANKMVNLQTQTYFNRSVNAMTLYQASDFINETSKLVSDDTKLAQKLDKFIDRVKTRVEKELQSNEIINVFQSDFEELGDEDAAGASKVSSVNAVPRQFFDQTFCKNKTVTCIKFHPTKPFQVAMSVVENLEFDQRAEVTGKSFDSYVLILNFSDSQVIYAQFALQTPVEISCIEFSPENPRVIIGGCINGQLISWDLALKDNYISEGRKSEQAQAAAKADGDDDEDKTQQQAIKVKELIMSNIDKSHKNFVADIQFVPGSVRVDRKAPNEGKSYHFVSIAEDGQVNIWDTRHIDINELRALAMKGKSTGWTPYLSIQLFRPDGAGLGLSRLLFEKTQSTPTFWATSDEGDLVFVDWSIRPVKEAEGEVRLPEYVQAIYESERNSRPCLALERSPFYEDLILTVHDFYFAIWKTSTLAEREEPIFRSANTFGSQNTCGAFSPTRPGVIFITKTNGIDIWDFYDQSNRPSITLNIATSAITYFKFQDNKAYGTKTQLMAYGD